MWKIKLQFMKIWIWSLNPLKSEFGGQIWNWNWQVDGVKLMWVCMGHKCEEEEQGHHDYDTEVDSSKHWLTAYCGSYSSHQSEFCNLSHTGILDQTILLQGDWTVHCRMLLNTLGFYPLDASSIYPTVMKTHLQTIPNVPSWGVGA